MDIELVDVELAEITDVFRELISDELGVGNVIAVRTISNVNAGSWPLKVVSTVVASLEKPQPY